MFSYVLEMFFQKSEKSFLSLVVLKSISIQLFLPSRLFLLGKWKPFLIENKDKLSVEIYGMASKNHDFGSLHLHIIWQFN